MAFDITNTAYTVPLQGAIGVPAARKTLSDQTATSASQDFGSPFTTFRALVYIPTYVVGTATAGPIIELQVGVTDFATRDRKTVA